MVTTVKKIQFPLNKVASGRYSCWCSSPLRCVLAWMMWWFLGRYVGQLSSDQNPHYLLYIGDFTTQLFRYCNISHFSNPYINRSISSNVIKVSNVLHCHSGSKKTHGTVEKSKRSCIPWCHGGLENVSSGTTMTDCCIHQSKESVTVIVIDFSHQYTHFKLHCKAYIWNTPTTFFWIDCFWSFCFCALKPPRHLRWNSLLARHQNFEIVSNFETPRCPEKIHELFL